MQSTENEEKLEDHRVGQFHPHLRFHDCFLGGVLPKATNGLIRRFLNWLNWVYEPSMANHPQTCMVTSIPISLVVRGQMTI
jgi:hypothetical protein